MATSVNLQSLAALGGILVGLGYVFEYLEKTVSDRARKDFVGWLRRVERRPFSNLPPACSSLFLRMFDQIYCRGKSSTRDYAWAWVTGMFVVSLTLVPYSRVLGLATPSIEGVLALGAITGCVYSLSYYGVDRRSLSPQLIIAATLICILVVVAGLVYGKIHHLPPAKPPYHYFVPDLMLISIPALLVSFLFRDTLNRISPWRAVLTSLGAMLLIGLLARGTARSFLSDVNLHGWTVGGYLLLNICVDSWSLLETRSVLTLARRVSVLGLLAIIVLDFSASATIFLAIPIASGNLGLFADAVRFSGDRPWIGVLFWSSFSTSIFFYLFLVSAAALAALNTAVKGLVSLDRFLPISQKPFRCLGVVAMLIAALLFLLFCCFL